VSRRTTKRSAKRVSDDHPSIWFFVALGLGVVLLIWVFAHVATKPVTPPAATTTTTRTR
jgi:hypothetical protein